MLTPKKFLHNHVLVVLREQRCVSMAKRMKPTRFEMPPFVTAFRPYLFHKASGQYGCLPALRSAANTQSFSLCRDDSLSFNSDSARAASSGRSLADRGIDDLGLSHPHRRMHSSSGLRSRYSFATVRAYFELSSETSRRGGVLVPKRVPSELLLNFASGLTFRTQTIRSHKVPVQLANASDCRLAAHCARLGNSDLPPPVTEKV